MTNEELNTALYKKVFAEQEQYREWLLSQPPNEILNHCYEYTVREDIVLALEEYDLSDKQCKALLKSPCPLADVFAEIILGREAEKPPVFYRQKERRHTELLMPELSGTTDRVEKYLQGLGIHPVIIRYCLDSKLLFESADYHHAVFKDNYQPFSCTEA